ncbi:MAG TPA: hypothetical protein VKX28_19320 [Xanthobacteraceae bacterium]|jgi:hypothetical protein|nr:hypothetical protein [Xanthobacteraceae bacterium]
MLIALVLSLAATVQADAKNITVKSWCPITGAVGIGHGGTFEAAKDAAIKACLDHGGLAKCCYKFFRQVG